MNFFEAYNKIFFNRTTIFIVGILIVIFIVVIGIESNNNRDSMYNSHWKNREILGEITNKTSHTNYDEPIIYIESSSGDFSYSFRNDTSGLFDYVIPGDSIVKTAGTNIVKIIRDQQEVIYKVWYRTK